MIQKSANLAIIPSTDTLCFSSPAHLCCPYDGSDQWNAAEWCSASSGHSPQLAFTVPLFGNQPPHEKRDIPEITNREQSQPYGEALEGVTWGGQREKLTGTKTPDLWVEAAQISGPSCSSQYHSGSEIHCPQPKPAKSMIDNILGKYFSHWFGMVC